MSTNEIPYKKVFHIRRAIVIGLLIILGIAVATGFIRLQTDHVIAPPGLRLVDAFWRFFICRCPVFPNPLDL